MVTISKNTSIKMNKIKEILIGTNNIGKYREISDLLPKGIKKYSLKESCSICNEKTVSVHPAKFSPDDKYLRYRILDKK